MNDLTALIGGHATLAMPASMDLDSVARFIAPIRLTKTFQIGATASVFQGLTPEGRTCVVKAYRQAYDRAGAGALEMEKVDFEVYAAQIAAHLPGGFAPACLAKGRISALIYTLWTPAKGNSLSSLLGARKLPPPQSRQAMAQSLISAVEQIHKADLLHLDLKPEHVFIERFPPYGVQIIDWAQARHRNHDPRPDSTLFATPGYTRPERLQGAKACQEDDWYAVNRILKDCLKVY